MVSHMKTTIDIPDPLMQQAKRVSARKGITLKQMVEAGLRFVLNREQEKPVHFKLKKYPFKGHGLVAGLTEGDWGEIRKRAYEGRGG